MSEINDISLQMAIKDPERWVLALKLSKAHIDYMLFSPEADDSLIAGKIALQGWEEDYLKSIENAIYDHSPLLADFKRVVVMVDNDKYAIVPTGPDAETVFGILYREFSGETMQASMPGNSTIVYGVSDGLEGFFTRTYSKVEFCHSLSVAKYFKQKACLGGNAKLYVVASDDRVEIFGFKHGELEIASVNTFRHINDAAYLVFASWNQAEMDIATDEIVLYGNASVRKQLSEILKRFITFVMPAVYPAQALKIGREIASVPFDLIITAAYENNKR